MPPGLVGRVGDVRYRNGLSLSGKMRLAKLLQKGKYNTGPIPADPQTA